MAEYDRFAGMPRRIIKEGRSKPDSELVEPLQQAFLSCVSWLPETLAYDLFLCFSDPYGQTPTVDDIQVVGEKLLEVVYLFEMEYERVVETFTDDEWRYISDSVSDCAFELDQKLLTYIMQKVVAKGLLG